MTQAGSGSLFRPEALEHYLEAEEGRALARVAPPGAWSLLIILLAALGTALAAACLGRVEVKGRARGILHPESGIPRVLCQVDGTVSQVVVHSGQRVAAGAVLLRLEAPALEARLYEARRAAESVRAAFREASRHQDAAHARQCATLARRRAGLEAQCRSQARSVAHVGRRLEALARLGAEGVISPDAVEAAREDLAQAQRALQGAEQGLDQAVQEQAGLDHQRQELLWRREQTIRNAETQERALAILQAQTVVRAPREGIVEALLVKPGDVVAPGRPLGKVVPDGIPLHAVAFLDEKDRAFVKAGDAAVLEMDQLPYAEYGTVSARVLRVSSDLAAPHEVAEALGEGPALAGPAFRVELVLTDAGAAARAGVPLRSGMLLRARFTLRRQRAITLALEPLRKWLR
ncbi:HlyD family secretion protein [Mesoterricola sediminis]|uniref:HlyD family secretion protein n=1 Tax=Mesoterricola sediminis TaxID=2927980 RepID=UPI001FB01C13|nr:HlyD family efflux transporter periplasmic adaptor subunit [Mesoterricola sediminis]